MIEEEPATSERLVALLRANRIEVVGIGATLNEGRRELASTTPDVVFITIQLVRGASLQTSIILRHPGPAYVLTTTDPTHGLDAHELGVADYLLKPFTTDRVSLCAGRLGTRVRARNLLRSPDLRTLRTRPIGR